MGITLADDLDGDLESRRGPGRELAGVAGIGPGQADAGAGAGAGAGQVLQQGPGGVAVLEAGGGDHDGQNQAGGVDGNVALARLTFLALSQPQVAFGTVSAARTD